MRLVMHRHDGLFAVHHHDAEPHTRRERNTLKHATSHRNPSSAEILPKTITAEIAEKTKTKKFWR
jgi:hypothetical protein